MTDDDFDAVTALEEEVGELETMTELFRAHIGDQLTGKEHGVFYFVARLEEHVGRLQEAVERCSGTVWAAEDHARDPNRGDSDA
jgi:hypothetical protein